MARSYLFIPGNEPRMLQNAEIFEADAIILDLEDAIGVDEKDEARTLTRRFLKEHPREGTPFYVRINSEKDLMRLDLDMLKDCDFEGVVLPKASMRMLARFENEASEVRIKKKILALIETPEAFFDLQHMGEYDQVKGYILGAVDLTRALGATRTVEGDEIAYARGMLKMRAAAYNLEAIDTPWASLDAASFDRDIEKARIMGFDGKCAIHPNQVPKINEAFAPSKAAIKEAKRIVKKHEATNSFRFALDGHMVDKPVVDAARATLEKARRYGLKEADDDTT
ncbi:MAG: HpcH/HpaI aldolase/citrate lyase family protein [Bacillota bacterium]